MTKPLFTLFKPPARTILAPAMAVVLIVSLLSGTLAVHAQSQPDLTKQYTWDAYALTFRYPDDWVTQTNDTSVSVRPSDRDVSDGFGPELVFFAVETTGTTPADLRAAVRDVTDQIDGTIMPLVPGTLEGRATMTADVYWTTPAATGQVVLIVIDPATVLGMAYIVRSADSDQYKPVLKAIAASAAFDTTSRADAAASSVSVTSVQLSQSYTWDIAGLTFYMPEGWQADLMVVDGRDQLALMPAEATADNYPTVRAALFDTTADTDIRAIIDTVGENFERVAGPVETVVAGYPADVYDFIEPSSSPLNVRVVTFPLEQRNMVALVIFGAYQSDWDDFRPTASAMISSITTTAAPRAAQPDRGHFTLAAHTTTSPGQPVLPLAQDEGAPFTWEQYNITFTLPPDWATNTGSSQEYDLALVSPDIIETGEGAFITLLGMPMLGTGSDRLVEAIQPITDQLGTEPTSPYTIAGIDDAVGIDHTEDDTTFHFILLPYGDRGDVIYIQASGPTSTDDTVTGILNSMEIDPLEADWDAVDAAWQASLAENNMLSIGNPAAPIRMREFFSFTCGHCVRYSRSLERLIASEVAAGNVLLDIVPLAGDEYATLAAHATYCAAEQGTGYTAHERLMEGYVERGYSEAYSREGVNDLLGDLSLDMDELNTCIDEERYGEVLLQNSLEFSDLGLTGTPTMTFGVEDEPPTPITLPDGQVWSGAIPLQWVLDIIDNYLNEGVKPEQFFDR